METKHLTRLITILGGHYYSDDTVFFGIGESVTNDGGETITHPEALFISDVMMELGFEGALIGHPLVDSDWDYITFKTPSISLHNLKSTTTP